MVVEAGHHTLPNGMEYDAGTVDISGPEPTAVDFHQAFGEDVTPTVFTQLTTSEGDHAMTTRHFNIESTKFDVIL
jgi:hypothetical protein